MSDVSQEDKDQLRYDMMRDDYEADSHDSNMKNVEYALRYIDAETHIADALSDMKRLCNIYKLDFKEYLNYMIEDL